jgi:hypothetical protein
MRAFADSTDRINVVLALAKHPLVAVSTRRLPEGPPIAGMRARSNGDRFVEKGPWAYSV